MTSRFNSLPSPRGRFEIKTEKEETGEDHAEEDVGHEHNVSPAGRIRACRRNDPQVPRRRPDNVPVYNEGTGSGFPPAP